MTEPHVHAAYTWWEQDARGIPLCKVCDDCVDEKLSKYRPEVLTSAAYWADEEIEPDSPSLEAPWWEYR
jgi:hypothetical protein